MIRIRRVDGERQLVMRLQMATEIMPDIVGEALFEEAVDIFDESQRLVPRARGWLAESGIVGQPETDGNVVYTDIIYGDEPGAGPVFYARIVHERLDAYHDPPTQAKFLEQPFLEARAGMKDRLIKRIAQLAHQRGRV